MFIYIDVLLLAALGRKCFGCFNRFPGDARRRCLAWRRRSGNVTWLTTNFLCDLRQAIKALWASISSYVEERSYVNEKFHTSKSVLKEATRKGLWSEKGWLADYPEASVTLVNDSNPGLVFGLLGPGTGLHSTQRGADILGWLYTTIYQPHGPFMKIDIYTLWNQNTQNPYTGTTSRSFLLSRVLGSWIRHEKVALRAWT